jgi:glyoxylase-like metal-dependent hydrolase (beta-lactamase superfamily II)
MSQSVVSKCEREPDICTDIDLGNYNFIWQRRCILMRIEQIEPDIYMFVGESYQSVSTAITDDDRVLLIDGQASREDAEELRRYIEAEMKKQVSLILCTHYMSDHMAALKLFPTAPIVAQQNYMHTFESQRSLSDEARACFVRPTIEFSDKVLMRWGRYTLDVFHNPSHTLSTIGVDIPEADLLVVGDAFFGGTVFVSSAGEPKNFFTALRRLQSRGRSRVIPGHIGMYDSRAFEHALFYLKSLQGHVEEAVRSSRGQDSILEIPIESCLSPHLEASDFEKEFHQINLSLIIKRKLFTDASVFSL